MAVGTDQRVGSHHNVNRLGRSAVLDGVRGTAVLFVLLNHGGVLTGGYAGVEVFFVLSGFLITTLLYQEWDDTGRISLREFYLRRARRLLPALTVLVIAVALLERMGIAAPSMPLAAQVLATLGFVNNWVVAFHPDALGLFTPTWTLAQEEQFYLLWPVVLGLLLRRSTRPASVCALLCAAATALAVTGGWVFGPVWAEHGYYDPVLRAAEPLIGCTAAVVWRHRRVPVPLRWSVFGWLPLPLIVLLAGSPGLPLTWKLLGCALLAGLLIPHLLAGQGGPVRWLLACAPLRYTGRISYGLYLYQEPMDHLAYWLLPGRSVYLHTLLLAVLSYTAAMPSWHLIERVFLTGDRRVPAMPTPAVPVTFGNDPPLAVATPCRTTRRTDITTLPTALSAHYLLGRGQRVWLSLLSAGLVLALVVRPLTGWGPSPLSVGQTAILALALVNFVGAGYQALLAVTGYHAVVRHTHAAAPRVIPDNELPRYSVLVPLYHEETVLPSLIKELSALDYPPERLQILLLIEDDDTPTRAALARIPLDDRFEVMIFAATLPRTKPKACNIGLERVNGQFCTIYDAEDRPAADQLRKAVAAFRAEPDDVVCVQAELLHWNPDTNWLTASFAGEYALRYGITLRGLDRFRFPIPLGGNSNHFRTAALCELGGWDAHNLTEDADLGIRIARRGWQVRMMASITEEEANSELGNWLRQRSRWIKGHLQTWLVHTRSPRQLLRELGPVRFAAVHLTVGFPALTTLINPILWLVGLGWLLGGPALAPVCSRRSSTP